MEKVKVLYFVDRMLRGGIQSLVIDWISEFDKEKIQVDFLLLDDGIKYELEDTLKEMGCNVYKLNGMWIKSPFDYIRYSKMLDTFFKEHSDYNAVHLHSTSKNYMVLKYAEKYNIPIRISHSHNIGFQTKSIFKQNIGNILKKRLIKHSTKYLACSTKAGEWLFGKNIIEKKNFQVIKNGIKYSKYKPDIVVRTKMRNEFSINEDTILYGHVGRFTNQKNHDFLIDIFYEIQKKQINAKLLLVGTGVLEDEIKEKVQSLKINDKVIFAGFRNDADKLFQAMDAFIMPSKYEGLGLVLIEAQATGLQCFTSDEVVPIEAKVTENLHYISLKKNANAWAENILKYSPTRKDAKTQIKEKGYFIEDSAKILSDLYKK